LEEPIKVIGTGGTMIINFMGKHELFGDIYYHEDHVANLVSFSNLLSLGKVSYDQSEDQFIYTVSNQSIKFNKKDSLYVWRSSVINNYQLINTVESNMSKYSKKEIDSASEARKLVARLAYPTSSDIISEVNSGLIVNCEVNSNDFKRADDIWGVSIGILKGKSVRKSSERVRMPEVINSNDIILCIDIFYVGGLMFLVSISTEMKLIMCTHIVDRSSQSLLSAITEQSALYNSKGYKIVVLLCDGELGVNANRSELNVIGIELSLCSKNEHIHLVERAIRHVKERVRACWNMIPYTLSNIMIIHLVYHCVYAINVFPKKNSISDMSPHQIFLGRNIDLSRDFKLTYGEYVQVSEHNNITNDMNPRTIGAIALGQENNIHGSYKFLSLVSWKIIRRTEWKCLPMSNNVIELLNDYALSERELIVSESEYEESVSEQLIDSPIVSELVNDDTIHDESESDIESTVDSESDEYQVSKSTTPTISNRYSLRSKAFIVRHYDSDDDSELVLTNLSIKKAMNLYPDESTESIKKELGQMVEKKVWKPVHKNDIGNNNIIRSLMFIKRKRDGRLKSRLVADGRMQLKELYSDISSPTVSTESVFISATIDSKENRYVAVVDIEGAYLHADIKEEIYMEIEPKLSTILCDMYPNQYNQYLYNGKIYVRLLKALYGCIESAKLFNDNLRSAMEANGFISNPYDICVMNKMSNGYQVTILFHVDDVKISSSSHQNVVDVVSYLKSVYKKIEVHDECINNDFSIDYLGMKFIYNSEGVTIDMKDMVKDIISDFDIKTNHVARTPAKTDLFNINVDSKLLSIDKKEFFHSEVAKLLYVAKRSRPDILLAISFLTTRVLCATEEDYDKLIRVITYLSSTLDLTLTLCIDDEIHISVYIDSSYGVHGDAKGQSGSVITMGRGAIRCKSSKQKLVAKSSTESELIGVSDELSQVIWTRNFLLSQGYVMEEALVYQDNTSTIELAIKGRSNSNRMRHVAIRYYFIKDRIQSKEVKIEHIGTTNMVADYFTKPLQGSLFINHRAKIMNHG
jgi:hypothetical protein